MFTRPSVTGNLWKLQDTYMSAKMSFRVGNANNKLFAGIIKDYVARLLDCWAKSFELCLNRVAMAIAHSNSMEVTNLINLLMEKRLCIPTWLELPWASWTFQGKLVTYWKSLTTKTTTPPTTPTNQSLTMQVLPNDD